VVMRRCGAADVLRCFCGVVYFLLDAGGMVLRTQPRRRLHEQQHCELNLLLLALYYCELVILCSCMNLLECSTELLGSVPSSDSYCLLLDDLLNWLLSNLLIIGAR
jgi:hypothetical protein